ncbi:MAG: hypothetical protein JW966_11145 [Anaerolineae bacterium]|nr:hypothetical protein [Anaerolineae bacterium]
MSAKQETHHQALRPLLRNALSSPALLSPSDFMLARYSLKTGLRKNLLDPDIAALEDYLIDNSNLPGRRGNLEMVWAFADEVGRVCASPDVSLSMSYVAMEWLLWWLMRHYPPSVFGSDPDSPLQMPQMCAVVAAGEWSATFSHIEAGTSMILDQADSPLWRIREGVAMGLQRMLGHAWDSTLRRLWRWGLDAGAYEWRAMAAGVAEPPLLVSRAHALDALDLHYHALAYLRRVPDSARRSDPVRTLRKALGYSISVAVAAAPNAGFAQMLTWAAWDDPDVRWVLRENLKKKRLSKWPEHIDAVQAAITM